MGLNYNPASVTQGLVYYLDLTNSRCYSGSGNTLTNLANGAIGITIVSGITYDTDYRKNLNFNGSSGYMTGNDTNLNFSTSDFTLQTTLKLNGLSNGFTGAYGSIICAGSALTNNSSIFYVSGTATSHYAVAIYHEPTLAINGRNFNFQTNKIYNLAVTKRYNVVEFFVDGSSIGTTTTSNNYNFTANGFTMGRWFASGVEQYLKGSVFDFRAYNRALSIDEIQQNYFSQTKRYYNEENIVTNGLILNFDPSKSTSYSGIGNTIYDLSGFGNNGALINGPTFSSFNGGALVLDGSNDYITSDVNKTVIGSSLTISFLFSTSSASGGLLEISDSIGTGVPWIFLIRTSSSQINWYLDGNYRLLVSLASNENALMSITYSNNLWSMYKNGVLQGTSVTGLGSYGGNNLRLGVGYSGNTATKWNLFKIYNRVLTQQEISQNFNATRYRYGI
jgi:hypothetical protein